MARPLQESSCGQKKESVLQEEFGWQNEVWVGCFHPINTLASKHLGEKSAS